MFRMDILSQSRGPSGPFLYADGMTYSYDDIRKLLGMAYLKMRGAGRSSPRQLNFEMDHEATLNRMARQMYARDWRPGPQLWFVHAGPPVREVFTPEFGDGVASMALYLMIYPIFERYFIYDSYSCRPGKGTLFGIERFEHHLRSATNNWTRSAYVLNFDIEGFFMSIIRERLYEMICQTLAKHRRRFPEEIDYEFADYMIRITLLRDPLEGCRYLGDPRLIQLVPLSKSMRGKNPGVGLTIGDVTHQLYSTVYLSPLDAFILRNLKLHLSRYVDDGRCPDVSYARLVDAIKEINDFLADYGLHLHKRKTDIVDAYETNIFLGAAIRPYRRYAKEATVSRMRRFFYWLEGELSEGADRDLGVALSMINTRLGYLSHFDEKTAVRKAIDNAPTIRRYFEFDGHLGRAALRIPKEMTPRASNP